MSLGEESSFFRDLSEARSIIFQIIIVGIFLGILINIISEVIINYVSPIFYPQAVLLTFILVIGLLFLLSRMFFSSVMSNAFYSFILFNMKTGNFDSSSLALMGFIYYPMLLTELACRELIKKDSSIKDRILSLDITNLMEETFFHELAELLIVSWLNDLTTTRISPFGGVIKPSVHVQGLPTEQYKFNEINGTFQNNIFKELEILPHVLRFEHIRIPKGFKIITSREKMKTELELKGSMFNPISFLSISFSLSSLGTGEQTILYMMGYTPIIIGSSEVTCVEGVIKGDKLSEIQGWTEIRYIVNIRAKLNYRLFFLPSFNLYFQWVKKVFRDAEQHFNFSHYLEQLRSRVHARRF